MAACCVAPGTAGASMRARAESLDRHRARLMPAPVVEITPDGMVTLVAPHG